MESFVVRVWSPGGDDGPEGVRGTATHLSSGASIVFAEPGALIRFLTGERDGREREPDGESARGPLLHVSDGNQQPTHEENADV